MHAPWRRVVVPLLFVLGITVPIAGGGQSSNRAQELGAALGQAFVRQAKAFAKAGIRAAEGETGCEKEETKKKLPTVCRAEADIDDILERIDDAEQRGQLPDAVRYEETHSYYMFQSLTEGLSSTEPLIRWNVLERIRWLCDTKTLLADAADKPCEHEVERSCLKILDSDRDPANRRLALEILSSGYGTLQSAAVLDTIVHSTDDPTEKELSEKALRLIQPPKK